MYSPDESDDNDNNNNNNNNNIEEEYENDDINLKVHEENTGFSRLNSVLRKLKKGYKCLNEKTMKYTYLIMLLGLGYEFFSNRALSNQVNELQGKVDNLYKQVSEMKNGNKALGKK